MSLLLSLTAGVDGNASGSPTGITLSSIAATASGSALAVGLIAALSLSAPSGTAQASALATGSIQAISLSVPEGAAFGDAIATGLLPSISLTSPDGIAFGTTVNVNTGGGGWNYSAYNTPYKSSNNFNKQAQLNQRDEEELCTILAVLVREKLI